MSLSIQRSGLETRRITAQQHPHHDSRRFLTTANSVLWQLCAGRLWACRIFGPRFPTCAQPPPIRLETNVATPLTLEYDHDQNRFARTFIAENHWLHALPVSLGPTTVPRLSQRSYRRRPGPSLRPALPRQVPDCRCRLRPRLRPPRLGRALPDDDEQSGD